MAGAPLRDVSATERAWLVADRLGAPFVNQLVVEGEGALSEAQLSRAVGALAPHFPGLFAKLEGSGPRMRWAAGGPPPRVALVQAPLWDGRSQVGAEFSAAPLDPFEGPLAEVLWVESDVGRLVVRTHHAATDGGGAVQFATDLFRALRGEPVLGAVGGPLTDLDLARPLRSRGPRRPPANAGAPTGKAAPPLDDVSVQWVRRTVQAGPKRILARTLWGLWLASRKFTSAPLRVDVPVDLRRWAGGLRTTANLTGFVRLDLGSFATAEHPVDALSSHLAAALDAGEPLDSVADSTLIFALPLNAMAGAARRLVRAAISNDTFEVSASVSNLGRAPLQDYVAPGFRATTAFWIPPGNAAMPAFVTLSGSPSGLELCATVPTSLARGGRAGELADEIQRYLEGVSV